MENIEETIRNLEHDSFMFGRDLFTSSLITHLRAYADYLENKNKTEEEIKQYKETTTQEKMMGMACEAMPVYSNDGYVKISSIIDYAMKLSRRSIHDAQIIQLMLYKNFQDYCTFDDMKRIPKIDEPKRKKKPNIHINHAEQVIGINEGTVTHRRK